MCIAYAIVVADLLPTLLSINLVAHLVPSQNVLPLIDVFEEVALGFLLYLGM